MDQHEVEFQRFLQKLEFSDAVWKQLVAQKILDNEDQGFANTVSGMKRPGESIPKDFPGPS